MYLGFSRRAAAGMLATFAFGASSLSAFAQGITTGTISGTISDPTGALLPGAQVVATRLDTKTQYKATTDARGSFSITNAGIGTYSIAVTSSGFSLLTLNNVLVDANKVTDLGSKQVAAGSASETVEVSSTSTLLETSEAQLTTTFNTQQLTELPVAGGFDELALLIPGVVNTHANNFSNTNGVGFSSNGLRGRSNNFEIDGQSNNDNSVGGPQFFFSNDEALGELQVISNDFSAQYGRDAGSIVNYITKSGTNQIHGSAFYRYSGDFTSSHQTGVSKGPQFGFCTPGQNPATDSCDAAVVPRYVENIWAGTLGAPIIKNKLFAFGSTYFLHNYQFGALTTSGGTALFPTPAGLQTLAATYANSPAIAILQQLSPYNIPIGNPRQTATAVNRTVTNGTTAVTIPFAQFGRQIPSVNTDQEDLGRLDYQPTNKDHFFLRYAYQINPTTPYSPVAAGGFADVTGTTHSIGADWTHTFSSRWVDQLRYSFQQSKLAFDGGGFPNCTISSFTSCPSSINLGSGFGSIGLASGFPQGRTVKVGQVQDNATWSIGRHAITFGGEFDYQNSPNVFLPNQNGAFTFASFSAFLQGTGSLNLTNGNPTVPFREKDVAVYFQDDWKISPTFTANLGLRWEFFQQAINLLHNESVAQQTGPNPFWSTALPLSQTTFPSIPQSYRNFEPRLGFAWNPNFDRKLVVRGGYAINVDPAFYNINLNSATAAPLVNAGTITCDGVTISCLPAGGATFTTVTNQYLKYIPTGGNPGARNETLVGNPFINPLTNSWNLSVQHQLQNAAVLEVRYVGNHVSGNFQTLDANPYLLPVATDFPSVISPSSLCTAANSTLAGGADIGRLHCGQTNVRLRANTAFSEYNALQMSLTTRNFHGVSGSLNYTHSKTIDNTSEIFGTLGGGNSVAFAQNSLDPNYAERADSGIDFPNVASAGFSYNLPGLTKSNGFVKRLTGGWSINPLWVYNSGQTYTDFEYYQNQSPFINTNDPNTYMDYSDYKTATAFNSGYSFARPVLSNPKAPVGTLGIYTTTGSGATLSAPALVDYSTGAPVSPNQVHFISNNRYAARLLGNPFPGSGRNILRGGTQNNVDLAVFKDTRITERVNFRLEANAYNVLNRAFFNTPDNFEGDYPSGSFNNTLFTTPTGSNIGPGTGLRNMLFGAKILF